MSARAETSPAVDALDETIRLGLQSREHIETGVRSRIFGPYLDKIVEHETTRIKSGAVEPEIAVKTLVAASSLYQLAEREYKRRYPLTDEELAHHQANVLDGVIQLVRPGAATTKKQARTQVDCADAYLSHSITEIQPELSAANYGAIFRKDQTMASAALTLDRQDLTSLLEDKNRKAMPHLTLTNWAIGETEAGIYNFAAKSGFRIRDFDIGSGDGATIAAKIASIRNLTDIEQLPEIAMTGLEVTPELFEGLAQFVKSDKGASALDLEGVVYNGAGSVSEFGALTVVQGDALRELVLLYQKIPANKDEIMIFTGNYSWHRLGRLSRRILLQIFSSYPNSVAIAGDLRDNTSRVNTGYFNLAVNGPLNCGNVTLERQFREWGYSLVDLRKSRPQTLDPRLVNRLLYDSVNDDGHLWIAHKGPIAEAALGLVPNAA